MINRKVFFDEIRQPIFGGFISQSQVDGVSAILDAGDARSLPREYICYALATARHETAAKMQPVRENMNYTSAAQIKKTWPSRFATLEDARPFVRRPQALAVKVYGGRLGNAPAPSDDGWVYRGDGLPQLTGKANFDKFGVAPGMSLQTSVSIMFKGMLDGLFTGKRLAQYFNGAPDPVGARAIINPDKNGPLVASYYRAFLNAYTKAEDAFVEDGFVSTAKVADDVPVAKSGAALTVGTAAAGGIITAAGTAATAAVSGISNQWALIAFGMVLVAFLISGGVGIWLWQSGRLTISKA